MHTYIYVTCAILSPDHYDMWSAAIPCKRKTARGVRETIMFHSKRIKILGILGHFSQIVNPNLEPEIVFTDYYHMLYDRNQNETIFISEDGRQRTHYNSGDLMSP